jgi:hypothetical protein
LLREETKVSLAVYLVSVFWGCKSEDGELIEESVEEKSTPSDTAILPMRPDNIHKAVNLMIGVRLKTLNAARARYPKI